MPVSAAQARDAERRQEQARGAAILQQQLAERQAQRIMEEELRDQVGMAADAPHTAGPSTRCRAAWVPAHVPELAAAPSVRRALSQERQALAREMERLQQEEAQAAVAKKARAAALVQEVRCLDWLGCAVLSQMCGVWRVC
jgi:hypothetical protein